MSIDFLRPETDDQRTDAARALLTDIEELLHDPVARFAESTLHGIASTVERTNRVTDGQRQAVRNIAKAVAKKKAEDDGMDWRRTMNRRYEGFVRTRY